MSSKDARSFTNMEPRGAMPEPLSLDLRLHPQSSRMQYRSRPVSVTVDPVSLVISECIAITSTIQKHARSSHSSVSAILGGAPNPVLLMPPSPSLRSGSRAPSGAGATGGDDLGDVGVVNRWGLRGKKGKSMQDHPLIVGFGRLRQELASCRDIQKFDAVSLLAPFLQIIQSKGTAAPITVLTLRALRKFLAYGFICPQSPRFALAMQSLSSAITHCQFDISDSAEGEVVLLMILHLMEDMLSGPGGDILSDESVCDMMGRGLTICSRSRFSEVLRRTAEASMVRMCQIIFEDLKHLEVEAGDEDYALDRQTNADMDNIKIEPPTTAALAEPEEPHNDEGGSELALENAPRASTSSKESSTTRDAVQESAGHALAKATGNVEPGEDREHGEARKSVETSISEKSAASVSSDTDSSGSIDVLKPYSLPSIRELFRVLVSFLDPHDPQQPDTMRVMALRIIHVALEVAGPSIAKHPSLAMIAEDRLCCHLFQLARSDNMAILQEALIVAGTLLATCRGVLKLQQELFLSYLVSCLHPFVDIPREAGIDPSLYSGIPQGPKVAKPPKTQAAPSSGRSTPVPVKDRQKLGLEGGTRKPDARQAMVETIGVLSRMPTFIAELFVNYDCDEDRADLCEDMIGLLSRNALPDSITWSTASVPPLCLDALLRYIQFIAERLDDEPLHEAYPDPDRLREQRSMKKIIVKGTSKFNTSPKAGLGYLEAHGIVDKASNPESVAKFLKRTSRVSKKVLGEFLSKKGNEAILSEFLSLIDFRGKRVDEALRIMLETFRLPGESPLIERIIIEFTEQYFKDWTPEEVADKDSLYVLTYAVIMLNTDQHNPNVKNESRMKPEDFARNLKGTNNGKNYDPPYLQAIYDSIKTNEIILPDEHDNKHAFDYAWRELMIKTEMADPLVICNTNIYDADMFASTWKPIVATLSYVFMSATDDAVFTRIVTGFDECARIAARYKIHDALDHIIYCLSLMTNLGTEVLANTMLNIEVQVNDNSVMVSELAVKLGKDMRAQLATLVLFRVLIGNENMLRKSWQYIIRIWLNLFVNSLIPPFFSTDANLLNLPPIPLQSPAQVIDKGPKAQEGGFFSAFTSYITSYAADDPPEPSDEELESTLTAADCINSCHIGDVFANVSSLPVEDLELLVVELLDQIPEDQGQTFITVRADNMPNPPPANGHKQPGNHPAYDPSLVYILEFCTVMALRDAETIQALSKPIVGALQQVLRDSKNYHSLVVSRATFYNFKILQASYDHDFVRPPVLLHTISSFPKDTLHKTFKLVLQGLRLCVAEPGPLRNETMTSPDFWAILRTIAGHEEAAAEAFEVLEVSLQGSPSAIIADNYEAAITLLNDFATAAQIGAAFEQRVDRRGGSRRTKPPAKQEKNPDDTGAVSRGVNATNIIYNMTSRIPPLMAQSHLESSEAWSAYWLPIFTALTTQCTNPCREVRQLAFNSLQRSLLSKEELACADHQEWTAIFDKVLFPLILRLLKPEVFSVDREGMGETRVQAASLLCKVYLQHLILLTGWDGMLDLWLRIIDIMDRLMNSGQGDSLEEAVPENLKNVLLFMSSSGYLVPPSQEPEKEKMWKETWKRIDRFLPELKKDVGFDEIEQQASAKQSVEGKKSGDGKQGVEEGSERGEEAVGKKSREEGDA
ncbi:hypothetical protein MKZ38_008004 [Zalerion maritima]|uniref:SEC7 domain-containing protein n=1 Tax=Zalerion maritima TaxID=339359 RepID=A0AAD5RUH2_9PEZI|nr:hypothetical protein MKZ38_008004 [Zalerion maritima]